VFGTDKEKRYPALHHSLFSIRLASFLRDEQASDQRLSTFEPGLGAFRGCEQFAVGQRDLKPDLVRMSLLGLPDVRCDTATDHQP
jgi:hypothetical protein